MADKTEKRAAAKPAESSSSDSPKEPTTETEVKQASATGGGVKNTGPVMNGPTQDDLNPAFAPPKEDEDDKSSK